MPSLPHLRPEANAFPDAATPSGPSPADYTRPVGKAATRRRSIEVPLATGTLPAPAPRSPTQREFAVAAVVPCYNRPADLEALLSDLAEIDLTFSDHTGSDARSTASVRLRIIVVDNASAPPINHPRTLRSTTRRTSPPTLEPLRLETNRGGSGGFNAGIARALEPPHQPDFVWLLDSDARVRHDTLTTLLRTLTANPHLAAAGSAVADPATGRIFEIGGRINRRTGRMEPARVAAPPHDRPILCEYVAACSALVRAEAIRRTGLMPDRFLNADDAEWFIRMARATGKGIAAAPRSVVYHPRFDRVPGFARYYQSRNALAPLEALGLAPPVRLARALREAARAAGQAMIGRDDRAALHIRGLADARAGVATGPAPAPLPPCEPPRPLAHLPDALAELIGSRQIPAGADARICADAAPAAAIQTIENACRSKGLRPVIETPGGVASAAARLLRSPRHPLAIVSAKGGPSSWLRARIQILVEEGGFVVRANRRSAKARSACKVLAAGLAHASALAPRSAVAAARAQSLPNSPPPLQTRTAAAPPLSLSAVVLSYNRRDALRQTLENLTDTLDAQPAPSEIIVVDNGSTDGSAAMVRELFPSARLIEPPGNIGVEGFNVGARAARGEVLLILDDDASPDPRALDEATALLSRRPDIAAVALHPRHPRTGESEWPFADPQRSADPRTRDDWPVMGCGNLVRAQAWRRAGGYERGFFLYRNDVDLALTLLAAGHHVRFDPAWVVWHDSPAAGRKSQRWFRTATRNWIWSARRHGAPTDAALGALLGWAWAHRLAGASPRAHLAALRGAIDGVLMSAPPLPRTVKPTGAPYRRLLKLKRPGGRSAQPRPSNNRREQTRAHPRRPTAAGR